MMCDSSRTLPGNVVAPRAPRTPRARRAAPAARGARRARRGSAGRAAGCRRLRSRSGGTRTVTTCRRKSRSSRKRPAATSALRSRLVAATTRTSTLMVSVAADAPDLALLQHAQELHLHLRADLADLVEEERAARWPPRRGRASAALAPVNAPRSWPKSSLSRIDSGSARAVDGDERLVRARRSSRGWRARRAPCPSRSRRR